MLREMFVVVDGNATSYASGHLMLAGQGCKRPLSPGVVERSSVLRQEIRRGGLTTQRVQRYSLLDGKWHHVLGYRIVEVAELTHSSDPTPQTGAYLEEVVTEGQTIPSWKW